LTFEMSSLITQVWDYISTFFTGDLGTISCPTFFFLCHVTFLGCLLRPVFDKRPDGKGRRWWVTSMLIHVFYIHGGSTVSSVFLGNRPGWMAGDFGWALYAFGWFLGGFDVVRKFVLETPAKYMFMAGHALSRSIFVSSAINRASPYCGLLGTIIVPLLDSHGADWFNVPIFTALEGKPIIECNDWNTPGAGLRNTFWATTLYYVLSGRAFGAFLPASLGNLLANICVVSPLMFQVFFNASILGVVESILGVFVNAAQAFREKVNSKDAEVPLESEQDKKEL